MNQQEKTTITVQTKVNATVDKVWEFWTTPQHIMQWNNATDEWHTPRAENDLQEGGKFLSRMEAKNSSMGFDFEGVYDRIKTNELIEYTMPDGRQVKVEFTAKGNETEVVESFDAENTHSIEMQQMGWQSILDNFKRYTEAS